MSMIIDGMDQSKTNIPHYTTQTKGQKAHFYTTHITGVYSHGHQMSYQYVDCLEWSHDSDLTQNVLLRTLVSLSKDGSLPSVLYLQMDHFWRENKNIYVLCLCALLVEKAIFRKIRLSFLMVDHTHKDIDELFSHIASKLQKNNVVTLANLTSHIQGAYDLPHRVEVFKYMYVVKDWLSPIQLHSRPHAFKFELCTNGKAGMWYCHWSSQGDWKGDDEGNPFYLLKGLPSGKPLLSRGLSLQQSSKEVISSGVRSCSERFTLQEREWWNGFVEEEERKRRMWESFTDQELIHGGQLNWYLDRLKKFQPPQKNTKEETKDVRAKKQTVEKVICEVNNIETGCSQEKEAIRSWNLTITICD
ncbi:uncharacterized protein LOC135687774 isoform X1 [Rhopilema esculentum]|uniref:uncharacterized protein LOC135687774 isoform X1 n=2 Tax=Rhopilema esculentum TaxID=499914 RepID=UPI0031D934E0